MMLRLDDILAPLGAAAVLDDPAGRQPVHLPGAPPGLALPGWADLAALLNMTALWSAETLQLRTDGRALDAEDYCEPATDRDLLPVQRVVAARVLERLADGACLIAKQIDTLDPAIKRITVALETGLSARVTGDLHLRQTPGPLVETTLALEDRLVLLLAGTMAATLQESGIENPVPHPTFGRPDPAVSPGTPEFAPTMAAGDRLYIPRGRLYALTGVDSDTACLLFSLARPTGLDLLQALSDEAVEDPFFRATLSRPAPAEPTNRPDLNLLGDRLGDLAASAKGAAALARLERELRRDLTDYALPGSTDAHYRRNAAQLEVVETAGGWLLRAARGAVPIPPGRERLVAWIAAREGFSRQELDGAFPDSDPEIVGTLLRELAAMKVITSTR
jgi:hypothetical protein